MDGFYARMYVGEFGNNAGKCVCKSTVMGGVRRCVPLYRVESGDISKLFSITWTRIVYFLGLIITRLPRKLFSFCLPFIKVLECRQHLVTFS